MMKIIRYLLISFISLFIIGIFTLILIWFYAVDKWGTYDRDALENLSLSTYLYDNSDNMIATVFSGENRTKTDISELPDHVLNSFVAAEDLRFYNHIGIDPYRMLGALAANLKSGRIVQGASTITQQLVKLSHGLTPEKKYMRKLQEAYYAILIERDYSKDEILEMYLDCVYFGNGAYGIESAAKKYFGKTAKELDLIESTALAAVLKAPSNYAPHLNEENNKRRRNSILNTMLENNMIDEREASAAMEAPLPLTDTAGSANNTAIYSWFIKKAVEDAANLLDISTQELFTGGYRIFTTLDASAQETAVQILCEGDLIPISSAGTNAECALVYINKNGAVEALIGGANKSASDFSRATDAKRQPGSVLKPLAVYTPCIEIKGLMPTDALRDEQMDFNGYVPSNYGNALYGKISFRKVFEKSLNIPAVYLLDQLGVENSRDYLNRFGISFENEDRYLSLALGSMKYGASPYELANAYLTFINHGFRPKAYTIRFITNSKGELLYENNESRQYVSSPSSAFIVCDLMRSTALDGTAKKLSVYGHPIGAKTGTVDYNGVGNRDAWICTITPNHSLTVWMGFDQTNENTHLDSSVTGSNQPASAALRFFQEHLPDGDGEFIKPDGINWYAIDKKTYDEEFAIKAATTITPQEYITYELFENSKAPSEVSDFWQIPGLPEDIFISRNIGQGISIGFTSTSVNARYRIYRRKNQSDGFTEIYTVSNIEQGEQITYSDNDAGLLSQYEYCLTAEHALAYDMGVHSAVTDPSPVYTAPRSFDWFERWSIPD